MPDSFWHAAALVGSIVGATWVLRSKLSDIEHELKTHIARSTADHEALRARVINIEEARAARRNRE